MEAFMHGALLNLGLLLGPGAQNIFVFQQGMISRKVVLVGGASSVCDMFLLALGVFGLGSAIAQSPGLGTALLVGGMSFLLYHGVASFKASAQPLLCSKHELTPSSNKKIFLKTVSFSLLNPSVYLDTVAIVGVVGALYPRPGNTLFFLGATSTSFLWFFFLSLAGQTIGENFIKSSERLAYVHRFAGTGMIINALIVLSVLIERL